MVSKSFAEILNEISKTKEEVFHFSASPTKNSQDNGTPTFSKQSVFELSQLGILKKNNSHFANNNFKVKKSHSYFHTPNLSFKTPQKPKAPLLKKQRPKGVPHKLDEIQKKAFTFFINHQEFLLEDFTRDELKKSFKKLCFQMHPDSSNGSHQSFIELKKNYDHLVKIFN